MKKVVLLLVLVMSSLILLVACGSGGSTPVTPAAPLPEVSFTISSENINFGDEVIISTRIKNAVSATLITIDTTLSVKDGDNKVLQLLASTNVTLTATNSDGKTATTSKTITVGPWNQSTKGLINHNNKHWVIFSREIIVNNVVIINDPIGQDEVGKYFVFSLNGFVNFYNKNNNLLWNKNNVSWKFVENETKLKFSNQDGSIVYFLNKLDENFLAFSYQITVGDNPGFVVETYKIEE